MSSPPPPPAASPPMAAEDEARDWAEMPSDALAAVFAKLDVAEILHGAGLVCRAWRRLAASDPTLWRRVDMTYQGDQLQAEEVEAMARAAVDRSAGTMEAFGAETFVNDELLRYISQSGQREEDPDYADGSHGWYWGEAVHLDTPYWGK